MKNPALLLFCAAAMMMAGLAGCSKSADTHVSTQAEHDAFKGRQATPEEMAAAMAKAQAHQSPPQQPK